MAPNWNSTALVFPGQASQQVGMGADIAAQHPAATAVFQQADAIYGEPFSRLLFEGPAERLDQTVNTQPALFITGIATLRALEAVYGPITPVAVAGHSLGEFTALVAAGALTFEDGLRLVRERARLMAEAGEKQPGAMAALLGAELDAVGEIVAAASAEVGRPVVLANDNCPGQVVVSGDSTAVDKALELAKARGIKRAMKLAVSVAAHSPLMGSAAVVFSQALEATSFELPRFPVIGNTTAAPLLSREDILAELRAQLTETVRWTESIRAMRAMGAAQFLELGPKDVLTGLLKRIDKDAVGVAVNNAAALTGL